MAVSQLTTFVIHKGTDFEQKISVGSTGISTSTHTCTSKIRKHPTAESVQSFDTSINNSDNSITISMASSITSLLSSGRNYFDILLTKTSTNKVIKLVEGSIIVNETVSD